jgi:hypothetical protein
MADLEVGSIWSEEVGGVARGEAAEFRGGVAVGELWASNWGGEWCTVSVAVWRS